MIVNAMRIRPVNVIGKRDGLVTVVFTDRVTPGYTRVHASRLYETKEEAEAVLKALKAEKEKPEKPEISPGGFAEADRLYYRESVANGEMQWRWLLDHSGSTDP